MRQFTGDTLVLATHNKGKIAEMRGLLEPYVANILTSAELNLPEPVETGTTFRANATLKALTAARLCKKIVLAEDSGLCVAALNDDPGVFTADWAGHPRNFAAAMHRVHSEMGNKADRSAYFTTLVALAWPDGHVEYAEGRINGQIVWPGRGTDGFGYDPIFMPDGYAKTFAEMTIVEKKKISHRSQALKSMIENYFRK